MNSFNKQEVTEEGSNYNSNFSNAVRSEGINEDVLVIADQMNNSNSEDSTSSRKDSELNKALLLIADKYKNFKLQYFISPTLEYTDMMLINDSRKFLKEMGFQEIYESQLIHGFEEAEENLLITHTTTFNARMIYALAQWKKLKPVRYFSFERVFKKRSLDATNLEKFRDVEVLIAQRGFSLERAEVEIKDFFQNFGMEIEFEPGFRIDTMPNMNILGYHGGLRKLMKLGDSGMFRPETLLSMGLPKDVNVIAWGLSLKSILMVKCAINDIKEIGPSLSVLKD